MKIYLKAPTLLKLNRITLRNQLIFDKLIQFFQEPKNVRITLIQKLKIQNDIIQ